MKFAIIAAGEGSRLSREGAGIPKPLVRINGEHMIDRLIRIFNENGAEEIVVIVNCLTDSVRNHIIAHYNTITTGIEGEKTTVLPAKPLVRLVCKTTPSSMHSFFELSSYISGGKFCLTTVDTIFNEQEFGKYIKEFERSDADGLMAVTDYVDDEKPLYVGTDSGLNITRFHDKNEGDTYISGGIYCLVPETLQTLHKCMEQGQSRMRNFQRQLVADGHKLKAYPFKKIVDVDHVDDIVKAEQFLAQK